MHESKAYQSPKAKANDFKTFGYFNILRGLLENLMVVMGGAVWEKVDFKMLYLLLAAYPILLGFYVVKTFKEKKVRKIFILYYSAHELVPAK